MAYSPSLPLHLVPLALLAPVVMAQPAIEPFPILFSLGSDGSQTLPTPRRGGSEPTRWETFNYTIADFEPWMLDTFAFGFGVIQRNSDAYGSRVNRTNINGKAPIDAQGLLRVEVPMMSSIGMPDTNFVQRHFYVTAVNRSDGRGYLFMNQATLSLNEVLSVLTRHHHTIYSTLNPAPEALRAFTRDGSWHAKLTQGDRVEVTLSGDWLAPEAVQEQVFQQTRCHLELDENVYYLAGCEQ